MNRQSRILLAAAVLAVAGAGCGKKGPPLAPIVHIPAAADKLTAARVGQDVYLSVTIPTENIDKSAPGDVARVDVFAATTAAPLARTRIFEIATKVASIDVAPAVRPGETPPPPPPPGTPLRPAQGTTVVVRDTLTPAALVPQTVREVAPRPGAPAALAVTPVPVATYPRRYYIAVAISEKGRQGPPGVMVELPLAPLPEPPTELHVAVPTPDAVVLTWEPSGGVVSTLFDQPLPVETAPVDLPPPEPTAAAASAVMTLPPGPTLYNVYRELAPPPPVTPASAQTVPAAPAPVAAPAPLNPSPQVALTFTDAGEVEVGRQRCYTVRAVRGAGAAAVLSEPSARVCITPEDRFPPAAPTNLSATVDPEGGMSLIWEPNGEADLAGYLVLRGQAGDATLRSLTPAAIADTRYTDRDVMPGVRYTYVVRAVDRNGNASADSNRAEETAR